MKSYGAGTLKPEQRMGENNYTPLQVWHMSTNRKYYFTATSRSQSWNESILDRQGQSIYLSNQRD